MLRVLGVRPVGPIVFSQNKFYIIRYPVYCGCKNALHNKNMLTETNNRSYNKIKWINKLRLTASLGTVLGIGVFVWYNYCKEYIAKHEKWTFMPFLSAAAPISGGENRRKQFNFIADVVEKSASSVVYIEIKDTKR